jgi:RNase H-fold protein (predicted Holliday junction resolvase)
MRTIGIDYGEKRIGVAVSDSDGVIVCVAELVTIPRLSERDSRFAAGWAR